MEKHLTIKVIGRVQGVLFRDSARQWARKLRIRGFTRNESDGSVYIEAEGEEEKLKEFLDWCRAGSPLARVEQADFTWSDHVKNFTDFVIQ